MLNFLGGEYMYRVLVVDDEPIHRREMAKLVRSLRNEYTVEEAENGKAALEMINNSKYNILITDVKMPVMDGLQLLESIEEKTSHMKIVVLSGYDYFEYAKGAIKFGACDYILKPVDPETVEMMLRRVEKLLKEQEENDKTRDSLRKELDVTYPVYLDYAMNRWIREELPLDNEPIIQDVIKNKGDCRILTISISDRKATASNSSTTMRKDEIKSYARNTIYDRLSAFGRNLSFFLEDKRLILAIILFSTNKINIYADDFILELNQIASLFYEQQELIISIGISNSYKCSRHNCKTALREALQALEHCFYKIESICIYGIDGKFPMNNTLPDMPQFETELKDAIVQCDSERIFKCLDNFFSGLAKEARIAPDILINYTENLLISCLDTIKKSIENSDYLELSYKIRQSINQCTYLKELSETLRNLIIAIIDKFQTVLEDRNKYIIQKCIEYISGNLSEELSVETLANRFHFNPNYFSTIFKKNTGVALSYFILDMRMQKAVFLLQNSEKKIYEIAEKVGFRDVKYFCKVFKSKFGVTPNHYRIFAGKGGYVK